MLVGKYIFVIFLSLFVKASFRGMGVGSGAKAPRILKFDIFLWIFLQKYCFLSFEWRKCNFNTSGPSCKNIFCPPRKNPLLAIPCKNIFGPLLEKNPSDAHVRGYMRIYRNAEGVHGQRNFGNPCSMIRVFTCLQGRTQGGSLGLNPPLILVFYNNFTTFAKEINCFRILFAC